MGAVSRDLSIEQGVTWSAAWAVQLDGAELDPAGHWHARSQVRQSKSSSEVLHEFTAEVVGSMVKLTVQPVDSSAWTWRRGVYDVEIYDESDPPRVVRIVEGAILVDPEVTR